MSTTTIQFDMRVGGVLTDATSVVLSDPTATFGLRRLDTGATVVAAGTPLVHNGLGDYSLVFTDPGPGLLYNYWVEFVYGGNTYHVEQDISGQTPPVPGPVTSGSGISPNVVPASGVLIDESKSAVKLARYFQLAGFNENAGFGVNDGVHPNEACNPIWSLAMRKMTAKYLREAQDEIEQVCGYPLAPRWIADEQLSVSRWPSLHRVHARWVEVLAAGVKATSVISAGETVDLTADPAVIGPVATTVTDPDEIQVLYPGTEIEIVPSKITLSGGGVTIEVPWARLVVDQDTPEGGLDYNDATNFLDTVDLQRVYNDSTVQGTLVYPHRSAATSCDCSCGCATCGEFTQDACLYVRNGRLGALDVLRADQAGGAWTVPCSDCYCASPELVRLNYRAGLKVLTFQAEDAVIRLAHAKAPSPPCGCGPINEMWSRDRNIPSVLSVERLNCPFGLADGSWVAFKFANAMKRHRMSVI